MTTLTQQSLLARKLPFGPIIVAQQLALLPLYFFIPLWIVALNLIVAGLVFWSSTKTRFYLPRWAKVLITLATIAGVFLVFRKISGRDAGVALISAMYGLKILETRKIRDAILILNLGFFILVAGFLFSQKPLMAIYQFLPVLAILFAFTKLYQVDSNQSQAFGPLIRKLSKYLMMAIPIMVLLFVFFPRLGGPLWRMPGSGGAVSGVGSSMSPGDVSSLQLFDKIAFRAKFDSITPAENDLYWRVIVLDEFDGLTWTRAGTMPVELDKIQTDNKRVFDYSITMEPSKQNFLVTLDRAVSQPDNTRLLSDFALYSRFRILDRMRYKMSSIPDLDIGVIPLNQQQHRFFTYLPEEGNRRSRDWALEQRANFDSDKDYIQFLLETINQESYYYTLTPPILEQDIIDSFWFDFRRGFCEHYAAAFVYLARAANVPARVVIGYQGGEKNPLSDYWIVRYADAHAWTEVWFEGEGWVRVDPTAAIAPFRIEESLLQEYRQREGIFDDFQTVDLADIGMFKQFEYWIDQMNNDWNEWIIDFNSGRQQQLLSGWGFSGISGGQLVAIMIVGLSIFSIIFASKRFHVRQIEDRLAVAYKQMALEIGKRLGIDNLETVGPRQLKVILDKSEDGKLLKYRELLDSYIELRYQQTVISKTAQNNLATRILKLKAF